MEVSKISFSQSCQNNNFSGSAPVFTGFVDRSVYKFVWRGVRSGMHDIVQKANNEGVKVDTQKLSGLKKYGEDILRNIENFMKQLHDDTSLYIERDRSLGSNKRKLVIKNSNAGTLDFYSGSGDDAKSIIRYGRVNAGGELDVHDLAALDEIISVMSAKENPTDIDKYFVSMLNNKLKQMATSPKGLWNKLVLYLKAGNLERLAREVGQDSETRESLMKMRKEAIVNNRAVRLKNAAKENAERELRDSNFRKMQEILL